MIRAANCAGASARCAALSTSRGANASTRKATPSGSISPTVLSMRSRSSARRSRVLRRSIRERLRALAALFSRRLPRGPGDRPQSGVRRLAHGAAAAPPRLPCRHPGATGRADVRRRRVRLPRCLARARPVRSARPRIAAGCAWRGAAASAKAKSIWRRRRARSRPKGWMSLRCAKPGGRQRDESRTPRIQVAPAMCRCQQSPTRPRRRAPRRASIAVMPFDRPRRRNGIRGGSADALAHDVITRLAKLRSLFVIAQGTVFALHERSIGPQEAGRMLNVDYVVGGTLQRHGKQLTVSVELTETRTARVVWTEVYRARPWMTRWPCSTRSATESSPRSPARSRRSSAIAPFSSRRARSTRGKRITAASGTCIGSTGPTTNRPSASLPRRCASTRPSRAPLPGSHSRTGKTRSRAGPSANGKPNAHSRLPVKA